MELVDDRTPEQRQSHRWLVVGTDSFMSGWGEAKGGVSYAAWACKPEHRSRVFIWVESRSDMKRVREVFETNGSLYRPSGQGHCHIYVVDENHPAIS